MFWRNSGICKTVCGASQVLTSDPLKVEDLQLQILQKLEGRTRDNNLSHRTNMTLNLDKGMREQDCLATLARRSPIQKT